MSFHQPNPRSLPATVLAALSMVVLVAAASAVRADGARDLRATGKVGSSLIGCVDGCQGLACLRTCLTEEQKRGDVARRLEGDLALARAKGDEGVTAMPYWVMSAVRDAMTNIDFCADRYLSLANDEPREEEYGVCARGAAYVFLRQTGWGDALDAVSEGRTSDKGGHLGALGRGLEFVVQAAEIANGAAFDARVAAESRGDALGGIAADGDAPSAMEKFQGCITDYDGNKEFCQEHYPNQGGDYDLCVSSAKAALTECLKKIY